ncbi:hypothetical protein [Vreelandella titanicae]|uniref:Uncharacterized protein n=1 Tax=Vreelandella titanicae TaxID=664683 RepID=A0A558J3X6_9GAMM|nr:hypothetical protein [Halomonas titanicae]TVU88323.1 hypothetical protein FQP89_18895 [Halomonas titanicae]
MTQDRYARWIKASHSLAKIEVFMIPLIQQLGRFDCQLIDGDTAFLQMPESLRATEQEMLNFNDRMGLSYLWVIGAYELIRTINQRLKNECFETEARQVKQQFNRLRVPLAKMEAAGRSPEDSHIAYPAFNMPHGAAWQLTQDEFITRKELSDSLLDFVEQFAAHHHSTDNA